MVQTMEITKEQLQELAAKYEGPIKKVGKGARKYTESEMAKKLIEAPETVAPKPSNGPIVNVPPELIPESVEVFRVSVDDAWGDPQTKILVTREFLDGRVELGTWREKTSSFTPIVQWTFPSKEAAQSWAQLAWVCGDRFE